MYYSNNAIVRSCFNHAIVNVNSCIGAKLAFLRTLGVNIFKHKLCGAIKHVPQSKITVEQQADIENLRNLMFVRSEQSFIEGFDNTDMLLLSTHSSLIIGGSPLLLSDGGSPPASPASLLAGLLRRRDPSTNPGPIAWWVSVGN